jgi:HemY protein
MAAARSLARNGAEVRGLEVLAEGLEAHWSSEPAALYLELGGEIDAAQALQRGEAWLASHPSDATLLHALGLLCQRRSLWGKARNYLEAAVAIRPDILTHLALAELLESLGESTAALPHLRAAALAARTGAATP